MTSDHRQPSHLFTIRIWRERTDGQWPEWHGEVRHVPSREKRYFYRWYRLVRFIAEILEETEA